MIDIRIRDEVPETNIFIGCVGYEERSTYLLRKINSNATNSFIYDYASSGIFSYDKNRAFIGTIAAKVESDFEKHLEAVLNSLNQGERPNLLIDITSLDRGKMAHLICMLFEEAANIGTVTLSYSPSKFSEPKLGFDVVNAFGPVIPQFMGNTVFDRESLALVVGAGYEYGRVVGAIDTLEPTQIVCFAPRGTDQRFEAAIMKANLDFSFLDDRDALIEYDLKDTFALYYNLRRIVEQGNTRHNVMILPLGPKIFASISMIVAMILHPNIMVWRHSTADVNRPETISDVKASGVSVTFSFDFVFPQQT